MRLLFLSAILLSCGGHSFTSPHPCTDQDLPGVRNMEVHFAPVDISFPDGGVCRVAPIDYRGKR